MKQTLTAALIALALTLTACGGSTGYPDSVTVQNGATRQCDGQGNVVGIGDFQQDAQRLCSRYSG